MSVGDVLVLDGGGSCLFSIFVLLCFPHLFEYFSPCTKITSQVENVILIPPGVRQSMPCFHKRTTRSLGDIEEGTDISPQEGNLAFVPDALPWTAMQCGTALRGRTHLLQGY